MKINFNGKSKQSGAALLIALIMLLILTIIGLTSMRGTSLQESMTGNLREYNISFQAAEAGLRAGERLAQTKFWDSTLQDMQPLESVSGEHESSLELSEKPSYTLTKLAALRTSTAAGEPIDDESILVRVISTGIGITKSDDNNPITVTELRSTYFLEGE